MSQICEDCYTWVTNDRETCPVCLSLKLLVGVPRAELEELVKLAELVAWRGRAGMEIRNASSELETAAAKFRAKHLEGPK